MLYPKRIIIETLRGCNLRCPMCPMHDYTGGIQKMSDTTLDNAIRQLQDIIAHNDGKKFVHMEPYCLGEPLLRPDFPEIVKRLKPLTRRLVVVTNAYAWDTF